MTRIEDYKKAILYGSVLASFTVEDFSVNGLANINKEDIATRYLAFIKLSSLES